MSTPDTPNSYSFYETVMPPPTESLVVSYLSPIMFAPDGVTPLRILTRLPPQDSLSDTPPGNSFIRVEAAGGSGSSYSGIFTVHVILHSYAPYGEEALAELNLAYAIAWMGNALGSTVVTSDGQQWYIVDSNVTGNGHHLSDPRTPLSRYRATIMWAVQGNVIGGISARAYTAPPERRMPDGSPALELLLDDEPPVRPPTPIPDFNDFNESPR